MSGFKKASPVAFQFSKVPVSKLTLIVLPFFFGITPVEAIVSVSPVTISNLPTIPAARCPGTVQK